MAGPFAYGCDRDLLGPVLGPRFVALSADAETEAFLEDARARPHGALALAARRLFTRAMSDFDANGLLGMHDMWLLGQAQWETLLGPARGGALLDLGAGDGQITQTLAPRFERVVTTELSPPMVRRLRRRGYACHPVDLGAEPLPEEGPFALIAALNLLDRCARPVSLLRRARELLAPGGQLALALPLPASPHVYAGPITVDPEELLPIAGRAFEEQARSLYEQVLGPLGLEVVVFARAPYLCRGTRAAPVIALDDAIFVLERGGFALEQ